MASLVQTTAFLTTEAEARALCAATGTDLGGVGSYQNKGAYMYASGKYAGKLYFSSSADNAAKCKALGATAKGAHRPSRALPNTEAEAKALAKQLGMSWGGTGDYQNKGAYAYKTGAHVGKVWWGKGGDAASRAKPLNSKGLFRLTLVASAVAPAVAAASQGETKVAAPVAATNVTTTITNADGTTTTKLLGPGARRRLAAKQAAAANAKKEAAAANAKKEAAAAKQAALPNPKMNAAAQELFDEMVNGKSGSLRGKPKEFFEMFQYMEEFTPLANPGIEFKGETRSIRDLGLVGMTVKLKEEFDASPMEKKVGQLLNFQQEVIDGEEPNPGMEFAPGSAGFKFNLPAYESDSDEEGDVYPNYCPHREGNKCEPLVYVLNLMPRDD